MIFTIQRFIEDYLTRRGLNDSDQYAVRVANLYSSQRPGLENDAFLARVRRIPTVLFKNAPGIDRQTFESAMLKRLDSRFKKKTNEYSTLFPIGLANERKRFSGKRRSIREILHRFCSVTEAQAIDAFWVSRKQGKLRGRPETTAQTLLVVFIEGAIGKKGLVFREVSSGIGFVDFTVVLASTPHLIEMKVLTKNFEGVSQLDHYMRIQDRPEGWLVVVDTRAPSASKSVLPPRINTPHGHVNVLTIDANPIAPSKSN